MSRVIYFYFFLPKIGLGAKTATVAKLMGRFCSFFSQGTKIANS